MTRDAQRIVLEHCRRHGIWIVADEVYERLYFGDEAAPQRDGAVVSRPRRARRTRDLRQLVFEEHG